MKRETIRQKAFEEAAKIAEQCYCSWHTYEKERADHIAWAIREHAKREANQ